MIVLNKFLRFVIASILVLACANVAAAGWSNINPLLTPRNGHTSTLLPNSKILIAGGSTTGAYINGAELFDPATGQWQATGNMREARLFHTATLLHTGKVLVTGGVSASAELYDPATGQWTLTNPMSAVRGRHSATLLPNGKVLVAGGHTEGTTLRSDAEIYDPSTGHWSTTGSLPYACADHAATMMKTGQVLITGGYAQSAPSNNQISANSALYDPPTGSWTLVGSMPTARIGHTTIMLMDMGTVLVVGGVNLGGPLADAALYEPSTRRWTATGSMSVSRVYHSATRLTNSKVLVVGGNDGMYPYTYRTSAEIYDTVSGLWSMADPVPARAYHTANLLNDGTVIVAGGSAAFGSYLATVQRYDYAVGTWRATQPLPEARSKPSATLLGNGKVLVAGGSFYANRSAVPLNTSVLYDPATENWTAGGNLLAARREHSATLLANGKVLIVGGFVAGAELYDPGTNQTTAAASPAVARGRHRATLLANGKVLISGGETFGDNPTSAELYDPDNNSWGSGGSMLGMRYSHSATLLPNGRVLVAGGSTGSGGSLKSALLYDPATNSWTATADMNVAHIFHSATLLPNGKVLVAGGTASGVGIGSAEIYDPSTGQWTLTGNLPNARSNHRAVLLANGRVMLNGDSTFVDVFDPMSGQWFSTGNLAAFRYNHDAVLLPNHKVMVVGGDDLPGVELYDPGLSYEMVSGRPYVDRVTNPLYANRALTIGGNSYSFSGYSGPSSGNGSDSASSQPLVQLQRLDNGAISYAAPTALSNSTYTSTAFGALPIGYYSLTMFVNASPSESRLFAVLPPGRPGTPALGRLIPGKAGKGSLTLEFTPPAADGGLAGIVYSAACSPAVGGAPITAQGSTSPLTITGLTANTSYICTLSASNSLGISAAAQATVTLRNADLTPILMLLLD